MRPRTKKICYGSVRAALWVFIANILGFPGHFFVREGGDRFLVVFQGFQFQLVYTVGKKEGGVKRGREHRGILVDTTFLIPEAGLATTSQHTFRFPLGKAREGGRDRWNKE